MSERADALRLQLIRNFDEVPMRRELRPPLYDSEGARLGAGTAADDAVAHAVASGAASLGADDLAAALRAVCVGSGMSLSGVRRRLFAYGLSSPRCRTVARMLCD